MSAPGNEPVLTAAQARRVDQLASEEYGVPSIVLMENAGLLATLAIARAFPAALAGTVHLLCGPGNNGGDAYVVARQLDLRGTPVALWSTRAEAQLGGDARVQAEVVRKSGLAPRLVDYVLLHELTHTQHADHSARFWRRLERALPDARARDRELRDCDIYLPWWADSPD